MKKQTLASILILSAVITGCENTNQTVGTLGGGALGAWAGSTIGKGRGRVISTAGGAVLGALMGSYIGGQLDQKDKMQADRTFQNSMEKSKSGQTSTWENPDSGHSGTYRVTNTYENKGQNCREFQQTIRIGGKIEEGYGTACRQNDGSWKIVQ